MHGICGEGFFLFPLPREFLGIRKKNLETVVDVAGFFFEVVRGEIFDRVVENATDSFH